MHCSRYSFASACSPFSRNTRPSTPYARARISRDAVPERSADTFKSLLASCALCAGRCRCPGGVARRSEYIFRSSLRGSSIFKECCICLTSATSASIASRGTGGYCTPILVRNVRTRQLFAADCYVLSMTAVESRVRIVCCIPSSPSLLPGMPRVQLKVGNGSGEEFDEGRLDRCLTKVDPVAWRVADGRTEAAGADGAAGGAVPHARGVAGALCPVAWGAAVDRA